MKSRPDGKMKKKFITLLLALIQLLSFLPGASAENAVKRLCIYKDNNQLPVRVMSDRGLLFGNAEDLAALKGCLSRSLEEPKRQVFYTRNNVIIHQVYASDCLENEGVLYVPLEASLSALGVSLSVDGNQINAKVLRTPAEFLDVLDRIINREDFYLYHIIEKSGGMVGLGEILAKTYAILSPFAFKSWWDVATQSDDQWRYDQAFSRIVSNEGPATTALSGVAALDNQLLQSERVISYLDELLSVDGALADFFRSIGLNEEDVRSFLQSSDSYSDDFGTWLHDYKTVSDTLDFDYILQAVMFYAVSADLDESTLLALQLAFENSDNPLIRNSINRMLDIRTGSGITAVENLYSGYTARMLFNTFLTSFEDYYIDASLDKKIVALEKDVFNLTFDTENQMSAVQYLPVYSNIQFSLLSYFLSHRYDDQFYTTKELRSVTIMYLKSAMAAFQLFSFDKDLGSTVATFNHNCTAALSEILDYSEEEYCPQFNNLSAVDWIKRSFDLLSEAGKETSAVIITEEGTVDSLDHPADSPNNEDRLVNEWKKYDGTWYAGRFYDEYGIYEEELEIEFTELGLAEFKWSKYRVAEISGESYMYHWSGAASYSVDDNPLGHFSGMIVFEGDKVTFCIDESEDVLLPAGSRFIYTQKKGQGSFQTDVVNTGPLSALQDGTYYFRFLDYGSDTLAATILLSAPITFSDEWVSTFEVGQSIKIGEGEVVTITEIVPAGETGQYKEYHLSNYCRISKGFDGKWQMYSQSDMIGKREVGTFQYLFTDDIPFYDASEYGMTLLTAQALGRDTSGWRPETLRELIDRRENEGGPGTDEFHGRSYEATVRNGHIISATIMNGP